MPSMLITSFLSSKCSRCWSLRTSCAFLRLYSAARLVPAQRHQKELDAQQIPAENGPRIGNCPGTCYNFIKDFNGLQKFPHPLPAPAAPPSQTALSPQSRPVPLQHRPRIFPARAPAPPPPCPRRRRSTAATAASRVATPAPEPRGYTHQKTRRQRMMFQGCREAAGSCKAATIVNGPL